MTNCGRDFNDRYLIKAKGVVPVVPCPVPGEICLRIMVLLKARSDSPLLSRLYYVSQIPSDGKVREEISLLRKIF